MTKINPTIGFISLGCAKALVDSELILTQLHAEGYDTTSSYENANLIIINTCAFINDAIDESLEAIGEALQQNEKVIVTGCLGAKKEIILEKFPDVLAITGPADYPSVMQIVHQYLPKKHDAKLDLISPIKLTPKHYAYLKIAEGCHNHCTFCIIPDLRGTLISRPLSDVLTEAKHLVQSGVKELLIIAQDTSAYGIDLDDINIKKLVHELGQLSIWIRLHYLYPYANLDDLIPYMQDHKILPYIDMPLQHASPKILKAMKRPANTENMIKRISAWRKLCPDLTLRTTFMVGFPGETEEDFETLLDFMEAAQFDRVGCFKYSNVDGARANNLPHQLSEEIKEDRLQRLMRLQETISTNKLKEKIGQSIAVMIDEITDDQMVGRSQGDSPDVDGNVFMKKIAGAKPGDIIQVNIIGSDEHDLFG
ncbi:MAG: ribosomal protein S12 methylthiotransferase [Gammaproteobacteria bacterium RIFCSPHIGHO2_02_FULL_42_13]|nr:MAG: ribosomal protein S12 methylthiotransferase [Gammaproteobacteria bacterium RIFCSPHIGHO2_02_FULL_42_13]